MPIDSKLIKRCLKNDRRSQNELYKELFSFLMNICIRYKNNYDDAGASLNTIYLKVLKGLKDYDESVSILPWVKTIAVRHLIDEYRSEKRHESLSLDEIPSEATSSHVMNAESLQTEDILKLLNCLPEVTRNVFNLFVVDGYKHREIGDLLNMSEGNSKWHLNQARTCLQAFINTEKKRLESIKLEL